MSHNPVVDEAVEAGRSGDDENERLFVEGTLEILRTVGAKAATAEMAMREVSNRNMVGIFFFSLFKL